MRKCLIIGIVAVIGLLTVPNAYAMTGLSSEIAVGHNILSVIFNSGSPITISDDTPDYAPTESNLTASGQTYDTIMIVNTETEGDGIADADGNVDVQFTLNENRPFCFAIHHFNGENSKLAIDVTIDGVTKHYTSNISGNVIHYIGKDSKYFSINTLKNNEDWLQTTSEITVTITNYAGHVPANVTLSIVFIE